MKTLKIKCSCGKTVSVTSKQAASFVGSLSKPPADPKVRKDRAKKAAEARWGKKKGV